MLALISSDRGDALRGERARTAGQRGFVRGVVVSLVAARPALLQIQRAKSDVGFLLPFERNAGADLFRQAREVLLFVPDDRRLEAARVDDRGRFACVTCERFL